MTVVRACHDSHDRRRFDVSKVGSVESRAPVGAETQHRSHTSLVVSRNQVSRLDLRNADGLERRSQRRRARQLCGGSLVYTWSDSSSISPTISTLLYL